MRRASTLAVAGLIATVLVVVAAAGPVLAAGEPTGLTIASSNGTLTVSWTAPTDVTPVSYSVRHREKDTSTWTTSSDINHPTVTYTLSNLTNGTTYEVEVSTSSPGPSSWVSAEAVAGAPEAPSTPSLVSGNASVDVSWTAPADSGSAITDYDLRYRQPGLSTWTLFYDGGKRIVSNSTSDASNGPGGDPVDFGEITGPGVTITREAVGTNYGVYKLGGAVDNMYLWSQTVYSEGATVQARYATTKPDATNLTTHGTQLWSLTAEQSNNFRARGGGFTYFTPPLAADSYFWVTTSEAETVTSSVLRIWVDLSSTTTSGTITGLNNNGDVEVQVRAANARGDGSWSPAMRIRVGLPSMLAAPTVTPGSSSLAVNWTAASGSAYTITDYDVQYSSDSGASWTEWNPSNNSTATNATVTGLTNGTTYQVQVRAYSSRGNGPWSPSTTMTAGVPVAPTAPTLVSGNASLEASWSPPANNGSDITDYDVQYRAVASSTWTDWNAANTSTATTATVTGLINDTSYQVRVRATNGHGDGPWSAATTLKAGGPSAPSAPTLTSGNTQLVVVWTAPADSGSSITDYDVRYSSDSGANWTEWDASTTSTATTATITGLTNGTSYQVQVRAANARADGQWGSSATLKAGLAAAPGAPTLTVDNTALTVAWTAPAANGSSVTDYDVRYSSDSGTNWTEWDASTTSTATSVTITGLTNDTTYEVQVRAVNTVGDGPWSASSSAAPTAQRPAAPGAPTLTSGNASLGASWTAPVANGSSIIDYDVRYSSDSGTNWTEFDASTTSTATTVTVTGLTNNTSYQVQVRAANAVGDGEWSASSTLKAGLPANPAAPSLAPGDASLAVSWSAPSGNGTALSGYDVQYSSNSGTTWTSHTHTGTGTSTTIATLANGTSYQVRVRAKSTVGDGPWSDSATMIAGTPASPIAPVLSVSNMQVAVAWTAPTDHGAAITDYDVRYRADGTTAWTAWQASKTSTATTATITGLTNDTTYQVQVRAGNSRGEGPWSSSRSATPIAEVPDAMAKPGKSGTSFFWSPPAANGSTITDYDIRYSSDSGVTWTEWNPEENRTTIFWYSGDLPGGRTYVIQVRAENSVGPGPWSPTSDSVTLPTRDPEKPAMPMLSSGNESVTVSWVAPEDNGSTITDYDVRYRTGFSWIVVEGGTSDASTSMTITGLTNNVEHWVAVRATNSKGDSGWSDANSVRVGVPNTPSAPTLTSGNAQLAVSWEVPGDGGLAITDYDVQYCVNSTGCDADSEWTAHDHTGTTASATIGSLTNGTTYQVQVRAKSSRGIGLWSASSTETPGKPAAPSAPTLTAGSAQLTVSWTAPTTNGLSISDYDVQYSSDGGTTWTEWNASNTSTATSTTITGLVAGTYHAQVRAASSAGDGPWSGSASSAVTTPPLAPDMPKLTSSNQTLTVGWAAPVNGGAAITDYDVQYRAAGTATWSSHTHTGTATSATVTGLINGTAYEVQVRAENSQGEGAWSASASAKAGGPTVPLDIWVHPKGTALWVSWLDPASDSNSAVTDYDVRYRVEGTSAWTVWKPNTTSTGYQTITGLTNGTKYQVQARAENANGPGPWSASITADPGAPARPATRPNVSGGNQRMVVSWAAPNDHGSPITDYDVRYRVDRTTAWTEWEPSTTSTALITTVTGLTNNTTYEVQVRAENARGTGPWSGSTLEVLERPDRPGWVNVTRVGTTLQVNWPRVFGNTVTGYHVVYSSDHGQSWTRSHTNTPVMSATITGTDPALPYLVAVAAVNDINHSGWTRSSLVAPDPSAIPPPAPASVSLTRQLGTLTATWPAVIGATGYNVVYSTNKGESWTRLLTNHTGTSATITGADDGLPYIVGVQAVNAIGPSGWTNSDSVRALLLPPSTLTITRTAGQIVVSWPAVTDAVSYDVVYSADGRASWTRWATALTTTTTTITTNNTATYFIAVRAVNSGAASTWKNSPSIPPLP